MDKRNNDFVFDFKPIGQAIKAARKAQGMTREQLARIVDYDPRHLQAIENEGQYPSLELFIQLVTMFGKRARGINLWFFFCHILNTLALHSRRLNRPRQDIAAVCRHLQSCPLRCKQYRSHISLQCPHGRLSHRRPNRKR